MPATFIPVTGINLGPVGAVSQSDFPLRTPRQVKSSDTKNIAFGELVVLNSDNTYSSVAQYIANGGVINSQTPLGIAVANTRTNGVFPLAGGQNASGGYYAPGNIADVLVQGTVNAQVNNGTPSGAGGPVYVRVALNGAIPAGVVGGIEAVADAAVNTTASTTASSANITVTSATGIVVGQIVTGAGIPADTVVTVVAGTTITLSHQATATASGVAVNFASTAPAITNMKFKTGLMGADGTAQVTLLNRQMP